MIGPLGFAFLGASKVIFRDRFACITDPANPRLADGGLTLDDIAELPLAVATFGQPPGTLR